MANCHEKVFDKERKEKNMESNRIESVTADKIRDAFFFPLGKAVNAIKELCRMHTGSSGLYDVVSERVDSELENAAAEISEHCNIIIDRLNETRARLAGDDVNMTAVDGEQSFTTGEGCSCEIHEIGISRIGKSDAWCLQLNGEDLDGTALKEAEAKRIFRAISAWCDRKAAEHRASSSQKEG